MGSLGPTVLIALLLAVATIAAIGGFVASAVARRNKRRAHRPFLVGFFCGLTAGAMLHAGIRRDTVRFASRALTFAASHVRLGSRPPQWRRQLRMLSARY
jgi:uncharacterized membrane protein YfcA